ncbi:MAG: hypothetical protein ACRDRQ_25095 [Pseudonocardiaceae bacterium]
MPDGATAGASRDNRTAIPVSCALHQGARATRSSSALMSPGSGVIIFEEDAARVLRDALIEWPG